MSISFNEVPSNIRRPFVYIEFDNTRAVQGPGLKSFKNLLIGQRLTSGSVAAVTPVRLTSASQAADFFGFGSMLHKSAQVYFANNQSTETWAVALADDNAGAAASGSFVITGPASESGTVYAYIGGDRYKAAVVSGDTASTVATALRAAINADVNAAVTAYGSSGTVSLQFKHKGIEANQLDLRLNYFDGEVLPAGLAITVNAMAGGTTNPDVSLALAAIGDLQFDCILMPYSDAANLTALESELDDRWGPLAQNDGMAFGAKNATYSALATFGNTRNSSHVSFMMATSLPTAPWAFAAGLIGQYSTSLQLDPARPVQTLQVKGVLPPKEIERLTNAERNLLLFDGISTFFVDAGGVVRVERAVTMYRENAFGADDISYLNIETVFTLSYIRYDFRNSFLLKYPRHKLADDGTRFGAGQAIITPKLAKAECVLKFREWESLGLVENIDQFKEDLIVERNASDPDRLDILLPPNLVNQLRVTGVQVQFLL